MKDSWTQYEDQLTREDSDSEDVIMEVVPSELHHDAVEDDCMEDDGVEDDTLKDPDYDPLDEIGGDEPCKTKLTSDM